MRSNGFLRYHGMSQRLFGVLMALAAILVVAGCGASTVTPQVDSPVEQAEPEPTPDPTPEPVPAETHRSSMSLRADVGFDVSSLSGEAAVWHERVMETIASPGRDLDPLRVAGLDDLYQYGRTLHMYVQSVLIAFRVTGDLSLLDHVDAIAERMRSELRDGWRGTKDGTDGTKDGYVNWVWRYSSGDQFVGKDIHIMDEMKTHAMIAMIAVALDTNRDLTGPAGRSYAAHADFWKDYLVNHFEAKWRERHDKPRGFPFMTKGGIHERQSWLKWHYYMGLLTGNVRYTAEAKRMAEEWWAEMLTVDTPSGTAYMWRRRDFLMPTVYAAGVVADVVELHLEGFDRWASAEEVRRFARTFTEFVIDTDDPDTNGLAADIGGEVARAGLRSDAENWRRLTTHGFLRSGFPLLAAWDPSGKIADFTEVTHEQRGENVGMMLQTGALLDAELDGHGLSTSQARN